MRLIVEYTSGRITESLRTIIPDHLALTADELVDIFLHFNKDWEFHQMDKSEFIDNLQQRYVSELVDAVNRLLWTEVNNLLPSDNFHRISYNPMAIYILGGDYADN